MRGPNQLGSFASDALMKLGLLGTIVGFILMLAPIAGLDGADKVSVKNSSAPRFPIQFADDSSNITSLLRKNVR